MRRNRDIQWESEDDFLSFKFLCRPSVGGRGMQAGFARLSYLIFLPCPGKKNTLHQEITPNPFRESPDLWRAFCNYLSIVCGKNKNKKLNLQILCVLIYVHIKQRTKQKVKILYSHKKLDQKRGTPHSFSATSAGFTARMRFACRLSEERATLKEKKTAAKHIKKNLLGALDLFIMIC